MRKLLTCCCLACAAILHAGPLQMNWRTGGNTTDVTDVFYSADGTRLLTCAGSQMRLYRPSDRVLIWWSSGKDSNTYQSVCPVPDGSSFFVCQKLATGNKVERRSFVDGSLIEQFSIDCNWNDMVAASATRLYISTGPELREYTKTGNLWSKSYTWTTNGGSNFKALAMHPGGQWLAEASGDNTVRVFDTTSKQSDPSQTLSLAVYNRSLAFSPDGAYLVVSSFYQGATLVKVSDWSHTPPEKFGQTVVAVAWYPDSKCFGVLYNAGLYYNYAKVDVNTGLPVFTSANLSLDGPTNELLSVSPTTSEAAFQDAHRVRLVTNANVDAGYLPGQSRPVTSIDYWYDDSLMFTADDQRTAASWDTTTGMLRRTFVAPDVITGMATGGGYLMTSTYTKVIFWNPLSGAQVGEVPIFGSYGTYPTIAASRTAVGAYGPVLAVRKETAVYLYKVSDRSGIGSLSHPKNVDHILFSNDSTRLVTTMDGDVWAWKLSDLAAPEAKVNVSSYDDLCLSPDGSTLYVLRRNNNDLRVYKKTGTTFNLIATRNLDANYYSKRMGISSDGSILAVSCDGGLFEPSQSKIDLYSAKTYDLLQSQNNALIDAPSVVCFSKFDQYMGFGETNRNLGMLYQTWSPYRKAEPWTVSVSPATVKGGQTSTGTVTLTANAPAGGVTVNLTSGDAAKAKPHVSSVFIPAGGKSAQFQIDTFLVNQDSLVSINALIHRRASIAIKVTK